MSHKIFQLRENTMDASGNIRTVNESATVEEPEDVYPFASRYTVRFPRSFTSERIIGEMDQSVNHIATGLETPSKDGLRVQLYDKEGRLVLYQAAKEILLRQLAALKGES